MMKTMISAIMLATCTVAMAQSAGVTDSLATDTTQTYELGEVTVTSQRQLVKNDIDRLTYDVQADPDSKTKTLMDMLRKVPMVTVDGQDNVKIKGSSAFKIYRNGHRDPSFEGQSLATILKTLPANTIKKIEVITDPGAKEDAEGTAYILNIVMMDNARFGGVAGSVSAGIDLKTAMNNETLYLTSKFGKLTVTANYSFVDVTSNTQDNSSYSDYLYNNGQRQQSYSGQTGISGAYHIGNLSASYEVDSLNLVTLSAGGNFLKPFDVSEWGFNGWSSLTDADGQTLYAYDSNGSLTSFDQYNAYGRLDYQHKTHLDGEVLTLSYMLSANGNKTDQQTEFLNMQGAGVGYSGYGQHIKSRFMEHTAQIDYIRPLGQWHKLEFGGKYIDRSSTSETRMTYDGAEESNLDNRFKNTTRVGAAYAEWIFNHQKWSARAGLRYEFSRLEAKYLRGEGTDFHRSLNDWVPSASVKYAFNDNNSLKLSFSTSISRPGIGYLNPTRVETPTAATFGNAGLKSSRWYNAVLDYTHIGQKLTWNITPYVGWTSNGFGRVQYVEDGKQISTYDGVAHEVTWGCSGYAQWTPWNGTQLTYNAAVNYTRHSNHSLGFALGAWSAWNNIHISQKLPWKIHLTCGGGFDIGRGINNVYGYSDHWTFYYLALQRSFLKEGRLTVQFTANNFFDPSHKDYDSHVVQGDYTGLSRWTNGQNKEIGIRVTWRFGKLKASVKSVDRSIENDDLKNSSSGGLSVSK